jgi:uncharacterized protein with HEPN domain
MNVCCMRKSDKDILNHILAYCEDVEKTINRFGNNPGTFDSDVDYRNSISMSLLQIGELSGHLSDNFRSSTMDKMDWRAVKATRNLFAHNYGAMDIEKIWSTALYDIPLLKTFCRETIK